jgi:phage terminase large subunit
VTRRWVREKYDEWGPGHPLWEARVLGQFPTQAEDALISLAWLEAASRRPAEDTGGPLAAGVDVAGPGEDETVLVVREGPHILALRAWAQADARGAVAAALTPYRTRLEAVNVDAVGIGYYAARHIEDLGYPVRLVNVGEAAGDAERYRNLKAEFYWGLRQRFQEGQVAGLTDERAIGQLAGIRYAHNARGQIEIERKEEARKRGVKSPDRAEALMLAFADATRAQLLFPEPGDAIEKPPHPLDEQLRVGLASLGIDMQASLRRVTCRDCANFQRTQPTKCTLRDLLVQAHDIACDWFIADLS